MADAAISVSRQPRPSKIDPLRLIVWGVFYALVVAAWVGIIVAVWHG